MYITDNGYVILPTDQDIYHSGSHKYIDKKMGKNGKWIYIYDTAKKKIGRTRADIAKRKAQKEAERRRREQQEIVEAIKSGKTKSLAEAQKEKEERSLINKVSTTHVEYGKKGKTLQEMQQEEKARQDKVNNSKILSTVQKGLDYLEKKGITQEVTTINGVQYVKDKNGKLVKRNK